MRKLKIINSIEVSKPCTSNNLESKSGEKNQGWFCHDCKKDVHDLSKYTNTEILTLIERTNGSFCALLKRRSNGTLITKEPAPAYASSLLAASVILAAGLGISDQALAENNTVVKHEAPANENFILGEIDVGPTPTPTPSASATPTATPMNSNVTNPQSSNSIHTRGEVSIKLK